MSLSVEQRSVRLEQLARMQDMFGPLFDGNFVELGNELVMEGSMLVKDESTKGLRPSQIKNKRWSAYQYR